MLDAFAMTLSLIALLGQLPQYAGDWKEFIKRNKNKMSKQDALQVLESRADSLLHKLMLYDLLVAFGREHNMNPQLVGYCRSRRPLIVEEFKDVNNQIQELAKVVNKSNGESEGS